MKYSTLPFGPGCPESQTPSTVGAPALQPAGHPLEHVAVDGRVADHAALADALAPGLELRLDQHEAAVARRAGILAPGSRATVREMNDRSAVTNEGANGRRSGVSRRALVRSITVTRGSSRSFQSSWP